MNGPRRSRRSRSSRLASRRARRPDADDAAFVQGRSPISWVGHWLYPAYREAFGDDLAIVPLPDFGRAHVTGMGSWQWGITVNTADGDAAWRFLSSCCRMSRCARCRPRTGDPGEGQRGRSSKSFGPGGDEHLYLQQLEAAPPGRAPRHRLSGHHHRLRDRRREIFAGRPVKPALDAAARRVEKDLEAYQGYPAPEP